MERRSGLSITVQPAKTVICFLTEPMRFPVPRITGVQLRRPQQPLTTTQVVMAVITLTALPTSPISGPKSRASASSAATRVTAPAMDRVCGVGSDHGG